MAAIIDSISEWKKIRQELLQNAKTIGFVPTMGNLHIGHLSLLEQSKQENDITVLSIFVNPTQFNNADDLEKYPRTLLEDQQLAKKAGTDYIFIPDYALLYPDNYRYKVSETQLSTILEGVTRPGHFEGMLTVVLKLLLLIKPTYAYFGEKDFQQLELVKGMVNAFFLDTEIKACPTIRTTSGLPYSSRNNRLTAEQYQRAEQFAQIFHAENSCAGIKQQLLQNNFAVDYVEDYGNRRLAAVKIDDIRLIDNIPIEENHEPSAR